MLTCQELTELVTDYIEGRLGLWDRLRFHMHIGMCRHCRAFLRDRRMTIKTLGKMPADPIPPEVREELIQKFRDWKRD